ncbi:MAG TPA: hypothetical protein VEC18_08275 [Myxococcota bacterium]|nr:hypothetical protein [Myxococcota bacterium]
MPVTYELNPYAGFIETRCTGDTTFEEVMEHFRELEADPKLPKRLDVFLDLDSMTTIPLSDQLRDVARAVARLKAKVEWGSCAILASRDVVFGMSRMFEVFAEGLFERTRVFRKREDAQRWLSAPPAANGA